MRHYVRTSVAGSGGAAPPSMYDWAGGTEAFTKLCDVFYRLVRADDLPAPMFARMDPEHARYVAVWLAEVFGGPASYPRQHGGYAHMVGRHLEWGTRLAVSNSQPDADPVRQAPVPRWGWGVAPPYLG